MGADLTMDGYLAGLREAMVAFARYADRAGMAAPVPTTPDWTTRSLIAHQGMVHRWATGLVRGETPDPDTFEREGMVAADPVEWLRDGAVDLAVALTRAPDDIDAPVFLADAPSPRLFWARRQCHETSIHAMDALSAALGRLPRAEDTWLTDEVALDGIDELLGGFLPRSRSRLRTPDPCTLAVLPAGAPVGWLLRLGPDAPVTTRLDSRAGSAGSIGDVRGAADIVLEAGAVALYLSLWNRSDEVDLCDLWHDRAVVTWS